MAFFKDEQELKDAVKKRIEYFYEFTHSEEKIEEFKAQIETLKGFLIPIWSDALGYTVNAVTSDSIIMIMRDLAYDVDGLGYRTKKAYELDGDMKFDLGIMIPIDELLKMDFSLLDRWLHHDVEIRLDRVVDYLTDELDLEEVGTRDTYNLYIHNGKEWKCSLDNGTYGGDMLRDREHLVSITLYNEHTPYTREDIEDMVLENLRVESTDEHDRLVFDITDYTIKYTPARYALPLHYRS